VCKSRIGVHLGKFPMVRRTLFCRQTPVVNSQAGKALVITHLISALWRFSLTLELKRSFEQEVDSNKCTEGLDFNHFYVQPPCNPLIESPLPVPST
jgi:hypothetical protein